MPTSINCKDFIVDQLRGLEGVVCRPMMGEFLLYLNGVLFGGIYDDRLLIKKTNTNKSYALAEEIPYQNAKPMYLVDNLDDTDYLNELIKKTCEDLSKKVTK